MPILEDKQIDFLLNGIIKILAIKEETIIPSAISSLSRLKRKITIPIPTKLPQEYKDLIKKTLEETFQKGTLANLHPDITVFEKFSEAIGSEYVGKANFKGYLVVKAGKNVAGIRKQANYVKELLKPELRELFPRIINVSDKNGIGICLMEFLETYNSLHDMIFVKRYNDWQIMNSIDKVLELVGKIYLNETDRKNIPQASELYQHLRIEESISKGIERYKKGKIKIQDTWKSFFPNGIESLLNSEIIIDGQLFQPVTRYINTISEKIDKFNPNFVTWIHGDLHPANIMVNLNAPGCEIKLIDPNPDFEKGSDYLYDMGKLLHWLDMMGLVAFERESEKELRKSNKEIIKLDLKKDDDKIYISYIIDKEYSDLKGRFFNYTFEKIKALGKAYNDKNLLPRLYLAIASAYFGGLKYFTDFKHIIISYTCGLEHLYKTITAE